VRSLKRESGPFDGLALGLTGAFQEESF